MNSFFRDRDTAMLDRQNAGIGRSRSESMKGLSCLPCRNPPKQEPTIVSCDAAQVPLIKQTRLMTAEPCGAEEKEKLHVESVTSFYAEKTDRQVIHFSATMTS